VSINEPGYGVIHMGAFPKMSCSGYDQIFSKVTIREVPVPNPLNPDPTNFLIERIHEECKGEAILLLCKLNIPTALIMKVVRFWFSIG